MGFSVFHLKKWQIQGNMPVLKCLWIELELKYYTVAQQLLHGNLVCLGLSTFRPYVRATGEDAYFPNHWEQNVTDVDISYSFRGYWQFMLQKGMDVGMTHILARRRLEAKGWGGGRRDKRGWKWGVKTVHVLESGLAQKWAELQEPN